MLTLYVAMEDDTYPEPGQVFCATYKLLDEDKTTELDSIIESIYLGAVRGVIKAWRKNGPSADHAE